MEPKNTVVPLALYRPAVAGGFGISGGDGKCSAGFAALDRAPG